MVEPLRRAAIEGELLDLRASGGDALECVPQRSVAGPHLVHGEIALEIAAFGTKQLDTRFDIGPPDRRPGRRIRRRRKLAEIERGAALQHAAESPRTFTAACTSPL